MNEPVILVFLLAVLLMMATFSTVDAGSGDTALNTQGIDEATLSQLLAEGQLLKIKETPAGKFELITGGIIIDRPPEAVYKVITDFNSFAQFMPSVEECKVVAEHGDTKDVAFKIKFKFLVSFTLEYVMRHQLNPSQGMTWDLVSSKGNKLKKSHGSWKLVSLDGGKRTAAFYSVYSNVSDVIWGLERLLKKDPSMEVAINTSSVILVVKAVKKRVEDPTWVQKK